MKAIRFVLAASVIAGLAVQTVRAQGSKQEQELKPTITSGKQVAVHTVISGSVFNDVDLSGSQFENVNMSRSRLHDINLSDLDVGAANLGGAKFKHIGPPPAADGTQARQRPVSFEEAQLCDSTFTKVDMSNVKLVNCKLDGMTIDGVPVTDLIAAYKQLRK